MAQAPLLPTHIRRPVTSGGRILRITEKYFLAIALMAFCLVIMGAIYLPRDELSRSVRGVVDPNIEDPHGHAGSDHREEARERFNKKVRNDGDLEKWVDTLRDQINKNNEKLSNLKAQLADISKDSAVKEKAKPLPNVDNHPIKANDDDDHSKFK